jgi:hypothetical protein
MSGVDLAAVAAFTAAGLSLVNVWFSSRVAGRRQLEQWRRDTERPIVARIVALSERSLEKLEEVAAEKSRWIESSAETNRIEAQNRSAEAWQEETALYEDLRYEAAQLDLTAGRPLRQVVHALLGKHETLHNIVRPSGGADEPFKTFIEYNNEIVGKREELIARARTDLGIDRLARKWPARWEYWARWIRTRRRSRWRPPERQA